MAEIDFNKKEQKLEAEVKVTIHPEDYQSEMDKKLKEQQKSARIPGFRPGKTPKNLIKKMVGKDLKKEIVPRKLWEKLDNYLKENEIHTISRPVMLTEHEEEDWQNKDSFTWEIKLGLRPEVKPDITVLKGIPQYKPVVNDKILENNIEQVRKEYGDFQEPEKVLEGGEEQIINLHCTEVDKNGEQVEGGIDQDASFIYKHLPEEGRKLFDNKKAGDSFTLKHAEIFSPDQLAQLLGIEENVARDLHEELQITINKIFFKAPAELNQELFDKLFGEGNVTTEEQFREKYKERLQNYFNERADHELFERMRTKLVEGHQFDLPEEFLRENFKKDQENSSQPLDAENLEKEFSKLLEYARWSVISETLIKENNIEVQNEEIVDQAKQDLQEMIQSYYGFVPQQDSEEFQNALTQYIQNEESYNKAYAKVRDVKLFRTLKEQIELKEEEISAEDFHKQEEKTFNKGQESPEKATTKTN